MNSTSGFRPEVSASAGTIGNKVGATTPRVLENTDIMALIRHNSTGITHTGTLFANHSDRVVIMPSFTPNAMSIPTPQIMISVPHGTSAMTFFSSASFTSKLMSEKVMARKAISILEFKKLIVFTSGKTRCKIGKTKTIDIIKTIRKMDCFCFLSNGSGF
ncbi:Uncharacterised protein [Acinetobacter baumannii]|nr:Uncharacterised protein [Acinetobacter baumannii]